MAVWGRAEECEMASFVAGLGAILPPAPPGSDGPFALGAPGRIERLLEQAELTPVANGEVECVFAFPDLETALRGLLSAGTFVAAGERAGEETVRAAARGSLAPFRTSEGDCRMRNRFRYAVGSVSRVPCAG
jgi:hypothetical protein